MSFSLRFGFWCGVLLALRVKKRRNTKRVCFFSLECMRFVVVFDNFGFRKIVKGGREKYGRTGKELAV